MATQPGFGPVIPSFRVKRSHKKSRLGCSTCKRRRVKCDETRPACQTCTRRGIECVYRHAPTTPESAGASDSGIESTASLPCGKPSFLVALGTTEAELSQHYLQHTAKAFDLSSRRSQTFWQTVVPALAFEHRVVRFGMLTAAALCMRFDLKLNNQRALLYAQAAEYYGDQFVALSSRTLRALDHGQAEVHMACSRLLTILGLAFARVYQVHSGVTIFDSVVWTWLHMLKGTMHLRKCYQDPRENETDYLFIDDDELVENGRRDDYKCNLHFPFIEATRRERFAAMYHAISAKPTRLDDHHACAVTSAISVLEEITDGLCSEQPVTLMRAVLLWPCRIPMDFVEILTNGNLLALSVYSHWLMLTVLVEEAWFMGDLGRAGIYEIFEICSAHPTADVERMLVEWPRRMLEGDVGMVDTFESL